MKKLVKVISIMFITFLCANSFSREVYAIDKRSASGGDGGIYTVNTAVIKEDKSLWVWGNNSYGQIGDGTTNNRLKPYHVMDDVKNVSVGSSIIAIVKNDGTCWLTGGSDEGMSPVELDDGSVGVKQLLFSIDAMYLLTNDGELYTTGGNEYGQLGIGNTSEPDEFVKILSDVKEISAGGYHAAAIKNDGTLWVWGNNDLGQVGDGTTTNRKSPVKIMNNVKSVSLGAIHSAAMKDDGTVWMWGNNECYQITSNVKSDMSTTPVLIFNSDANVKKIVSGYLNSAVIKKDGTLWAWGNNEYGQVGNGTCSSYVEKPTKIASNVVEATLYTGHAIAIKNDGYLYAWGNNDEGQVGDGTTTQRTTPTKIFRVAKSKQSINASNISKVVSSSKRTIAIGATCKGNATLTYKSNNDNITVNSKGKVTIKKNYIGKATITITAKATSTYKKATKKITVTVKPVKATINSVKYADSKIKIKVKKNIGNVKYQIQYATNSKFENGVKSTNKYNSNGYHVNNPKKGKTYYFRVRGVKTVNGTTYYGKWSDVKKIKIKK